MEHKKLVKHIINVVKICNNSSWKTYDGLQGKNFFSSSLQEKYFFKNREKDRLETLEYDKNACYFYLQSRLNKPRRY